MHAVGWILLLITIYIEDISEECLRYRNAAPKTAFAKIGESHDLIVISQFHGVGQVGVLIN